jgi:hypothetical protein
MNTTSGAYNLSFTNILSDTFSAFIPPKPKKSYCQNLEFIFEFISFRDVRIHEFSNTEDIFEKCKGWVNDFLALGSLRRKGFDSVTSYMHCRVYHVPFFTKKYGKLLRFSGQGVEKINYDIKKKSSFKKKQMGRNGRCLTSSKRDRTFDIRELRA